MTNNDAMTAMPSVDYKGKWRWKVYKNVRYTYAPRVGEIVLQKRVLGVWVRKDFTLYHPDWDIIGSGTPYQAAETLLDKRAAKKNNVRTFPAN